MGMFDTFKISKAILPQAARGVEKDWQTKNLECMLSDYEIKEDRIIKSIKDERDYEEGETFSGQIIVCNNHDDLEGSWLEMILEVEKGKVLKITAIES